jgi:uncharacterized membrane protein YedE/YeeE
MESFFLTGAPMSIDWNQFTPWSAFIGGGIIGLAVALLILLNGRIAGISGIVGGLFNADKGDVAWRIAFVSGLVAAPLVWQFFQELPPVRIDASYAILAVAGLIVGIGTRYVRVAPAGTEFAEYRVGRPARLQQHSFSWG